MITFAVLHSHFVARADRFKQGPDESLDGIKVGNALNDV